jgi:hypothetical protein
MSARTANQPGPVPFRGHRRRVRRVVTFAVSLSALIMVLAGLNQSAAEAAPVAQGSVVHTPTLKVGPSVNLVGNRVVHITGNHWPANDDSMQIELCSSDPSLPNASCGYIGYPVPSKNGSWSLDYAPMNPRAPVGCVETPVCYVEATDNTTTLTAQLTFKPLTVFLTPDEYGDGYYWLQKVSVHISGFPSGDPVTVEVCDSSGDCDPSTSTTITANGGGSGAVHDYLLNENVCSEHGDCAVIAIDPAYSSYPQGVEAVYEFEGYCGPIVCDGFGPDSGSTTKAK